MKLYWSDTHIRHANIIRYCSRPWAEVERMDDDLFLAFAEADEAGHEVFLLGDFTFKPALVAEAYGGLAGAGRHTLIAGNHEKILSKRDADQAAYRAFFGQVIGTEKTYRDNVLLVEDEAVGRPVRLLLSHVPQQDLRGAHFNLYGHVHNTPVKDRARFVAEYPFLAGGSEKHINVSVEVIGYRPRSLTELLELRAAA